MFAYFNFTRPQCLWFIGVGLVNFHGFLADLFSACVYDMTCNIFLLGKSSFVNEVTICIFMVFQGSELLRNDFLFASSHFWILLLIHSLSFIYCFLFSIASDIFSKSCDIYLTLINKKMVAEIGSWLQITYISCSSTISMQLHLLKEFD